MASEPLLRALLASLCASALMLLLRGPLRRYFGAGAAYAAWAIVPASMLAALLPRASATVQWAISVPAAPGAWQAVQASASDAGLPWSALLAGAWLAGAGTLAARLAWQQLRYQRRLPPPAAARVLRSGAAGSGPVLLGLWRPRLILPAGFRRDYAHAERRLVLAHERIHAERGDLWANAGCALLQCLAWCNPLIHLAAARFRLDQELACDAAVLRRHGQAATYARALLKTQLSAQGIPLACQWQAAHPLKERIVHLKSTVSPARRRAGQFAAGLLLAACSVAAWAAHAGASANTQYLVKMAMADSSPAVRVQAGVPAEIALGQGAAQWRTRLVVTPFEGQVRLQAQISHGGKLVGDYTLTGPLEQDMLVVASDGQEFRARLRVSEQAGG
ncbi:M56 family metallopeptidase [Pseudoduganella violaceinigra]|uniref:M56 family metallopeptidase n=1 Tax=Pseudoduganella violaceinigra TaxID=246602 RepID=UPI0003FF4AEE|nr:M56 family metallopeptidase [Pseudoduganella violaceinigra]